MYLEKILKECKAGDILICEESCSSSFIEGSTYKVQSDLYGNLYLIGTQMIKHTHTVSTFSKKEKQMSKQQPPKLKHGDILILDDGIRVLISADQAFYVGEGMISHSDLEYLRRVKVVTKVYRSNNYGTTTGMCHSLTVLISDHPLDTHHNLIWEQDERTLKIKQIRERMEADAKLLKSLED